MATHSEIIFGCGTLGSLIMFSLPQMGSYQYLPLEVGALIIAGLVLLAVVMWLLN